MIVIVGSDLDADTRSLVSMCAADGAVLLGARDLCTRGWVFRPGADGDGRFVAAGAIHQTAALSGVLVRRPAVLADELGWVAREDRRYVAAEISAFLVAWLSALRCPVINRPSASSLCGVGWSPLHWRAVSERLAVRWTDSGDGNRTDVVVCGGMSFGARTDVQARVSTQLAAAAGAEVLGVRFSADAVCSVTLQPSLVAPEVRQAVLQRLAG